MKYIIYNGKAYTLRSVKPFYISTIANRIKAETEQEFFDTYIKICPDFVETCGDLFEPLDSFLDSRVSAAKNDINEIFRLVARDYLNGNVEGASYIHRLLEGMVRGTENCGILDSDEIEDIRNRLHYADTVINDPSALYRIKDKWHDFEAQD